MNKKESEKRGVPINRKNPVSWCWGRVEICFCM